MIKIIITDDHPYIREGIKRILEKEKMFIIEEEAENSQMLLEKLSIDKYDIVLLDISMPGRKGIDIIDDIFSIRPEIKILILSMHPEEQYAIRCFKSGVSGYITKQAAPEELIHAIKIICGGGKYITSSIAEKLVNQISQNQIVLPHEKLSNREFEVFCLLSSGKTVSEIANELMLSIQSISTYKSRIMEKMNFKNLNDLFKYSSEKNISAECNII
jgi:DNA-binding NarL/FixJ family response regulator